MNITELRIHNALSNLGISNEQFNSLEDAAQELTHGIAIFLFKLQKYHVGIFKAEKKERDEYYNNGERIRAKVFKDAEDMPIVILEEKSRIRSFPYYVIAGKAYAFNPLKSDVFNQFQKFTRKAMCVSSSYAVPNGPLIKNEKDLKYYLMENLNNIIMPVSFRKKIEEIYSFLGRNFTNEDYQRLCSEVKYYDNIKLKSRIQHGIFQYEEQHNKQKILEVFEHQETRIAICTTEAKRSNNKIQVMVEKRGSDRFNFVDKGRVFLQTLFLEIGWDDVSTRELNIYGPPDYPTYLTKELFYSTDTQTRLKLIQFQAEKEHESKEIIKKNKKELETCIKEGCFVKDHIKFTKDAVRYLDKELTGLNIFEFLRHSRYHKKPNSLSFIDVARDFCNYVLKKDASFCHVYLEKSFIGKIGKFKINATQRSGRRLFYINGRRIHPDDLHSVMVRAAKYDNVSEYNAFLDRLKNTRISILDIVDNGILFKIDENARQKLQTGLHYLRLKIDRIGNKNYLVVKGKSLQINSMEFFLNAVRYSAYSFSATLSGILESVKGAVKDINDLDFIELIKEGLERNRERVEKSRSLLDKALSETNSIAGKDGVKIKGKSGLNYMIKWEDLGAYVNLKSGWKYICIIDEEGSKRESEDDEALRNDIVAKRIYTLFNDVTAKNQIYTLKEVVNTHAVA